MLRKGLRQGQCSQQGTYNLLSVYFQAKKKMHLGKIAAAILRLDSNSLQGNRNKFPCSDRVRSLLDMHN
jgi:hypothetical protein